MAASDKVTSSARFILEGDVARNRPNSEAVNSKIAGTVNSLLDSNFFLYTASFPGYYRSSTGIFRGPPLRIKNSTNIVRYEMSLADTGNVGNNGMNVAIYDNVGAFVGNLFGTGANRLIINGSNLQNISVERDVVNTTTTGYNIGGATVQFGNPTITTFLAGYLLVPFVENSTNGARSISLNMYLQEGA